MEFWSLLGGIEGLILGGISHIINSFGKMQKTII